MNENKRADPKWEKFKTSFAFTSVWGHNACASHACLHLAFSSL